MLGAVAILLVVAGVAQRARVELHRFTVGSYFVDSANRSMLAHLPRHPGPVLVEGYGTSILAQQEQPLVYQVVNERVPGHVSISLSANFANGIAFLIDQVQARPGPELRPYYRYVLTRLGGVQTDRQVIARSGGIALERRVKALDVFPYDGLATQLEWYDHSGLGWVLPNTPVRFFVTGDAAPGPVWARVTFARQAPVSVARGPGVRVRITPTQVVACVRATGAAPVRQAVIPVVTPLVSGPRLPNYARLGPSEGVALVAMHAVTGDCRV